jgi:hypothetical protein
MDKTTPPSRFICFIRILTEYRSFLNSQSLDSTFIALKASSDTFSKVLVHPCISWSQYELESQEIFNVSFSAAAARRRMASLFSSPLAFSLILVIEHYINY